MPLAVGTRLGPYEVLTLLGVGGMAEVYRGRDTRLDRVVAIKVISVGLAEDARFRERFEREAMTISRLNHANVCVLHDVGHQDGLAFLVMEFIEGETLADRIDRLGPLPLDEALDIARQMALAIAHAHHVGIVHRDIKPHNVMITADGVVKVLDFGLAQSGQPADATRSGVAIGTFGYMAPEQLLKDARTGPEADVWALGVVLYEMLTGTRPFCGTSAVSLFRSILNDPAPSAADARPGVPRAVTRLIARALEKDPDRRHQSAGELAEELTACRAEALPHQPSRFRLSARSLVGIASAAVIVGSYFGTAAFVRGQNERWARQQAIPEIDRLLEQEQFFDAFILAGQARAYLGDDPALARIWPRVSVETAMATEPPGADVSFEPYTADTGAWRALGQTPIERARLPRGPLRFRIRKEGYEPVSLARNLTTRFEPAPIALAPSGAAPDMVLVPGDSLPVSLSGFNTESAVALGPFAIDRTEVTNQSFRQFVDAGGYDRQELWPAMSARTARFVDAAGRPGPAAWERGFPDSRGDEPVRGVSWYEAAAYCAFRGKRLPTVFHWARAALAPREISEPLAPSIVPLSNFAGQGPAAVATHAGLGPYGTYDMAGNAREWIWNVAADGRRWILGGAWNDPTYMFTVPFSLPPEDRSPANGFRCMQTAASVPAELLAPVERSSPDYRGIRPVSHEIYSGFAKQFAYVGSNAGGRLERRETIPTGAVRERARVAAGYGDEQLTVYVFLPPAGTPPYQALLYFPALTAFQSGASSNMFYPADHIVTSGRALVMPVFKGSFERWDSVMGLTGEEYRRALRVRLAEWRQDAGRTLDYLATRGDIDMNRIGYYGRSFGASMPLALLALEPRFRVAVLHAGGFTHRPLPAEVDPVNYVSRVRIPTLLMTGRHDYLLPLETSQKPFFALLGTPPSDKKHVVFDAGHDSLPGGQLAREGLAWLDRYLGPPAQASATAR